MTQILLSQKSKIFNETKLVDSIENDDISEAQNK